MRLLLTAIMASLTLQYSVAQSAGDNIRISQTGYYPISEKIAVVVGGNSNEKFYLIELYNGRDTVYTGTLSGTYYWNKSGETIRRADFSSVQEWGKYELNVPSVGTSHIFFISDFMHEELLKAAIKGFYYQRASTALTSQYAGIWARPAGHADNIVNIHGSVVSDFYQKDDILIGGSSKGWYDAGDYNKYVVNSGITTYSLLALYEHLPGMMKDLDVNIPESGDNMPDILDEAKWNLDWMLTMQDKDGGVSHKLTSPNFTGTIMPHEDQTPRYFIQKTTAATLDFAAVMAIASRVYAPYNSSFADKCYEASLDAWIWARHHPNVLYNQNQMNSLHSPSINTGAYGDGNVSDEFYWAGAELYITTKADSFYVITGLGNVKPAVPGWPRVEGLAVMSLLHHRKNLTAMGYADTTQFKSDMISLGLGLYNDYNTHPFKVAVSNDFYWGSNAVVANKGIMLMQAYYISKDKRYLDAAVSNLYYLMGRNGTGYCYVTGFGDKTPNDPHHRISEADDVDQAVPGLLVGGPNASAFESCPYPSTYEAKRYLDSRCSYSTNEIAINWNAALVYLVGAIEAVEKGLFPNEYSGITSVEPLYDLNTMVTVFPNPTSGNVTISSNESISDVRVYDMAGNELQNIAKSMKGDPSINTVELESGVYFVKVETMLGSITKKLIKN